MTDRDRALAPRRPHPARDRLQADAVLVARPDLDRRVRMPAPFFARRPREFFFKRARSCAVAAPG